MKNLFKTIFIALLVVLGVYSCTRNNEEISQNENLTAEQLSLKLSSDSDFVELTNMVTVFQNISDKNSFTKKFDENRLKNEGNRYLAEISGYSEKDIEKINNELINKISKLQKKYPQLKSSKENYNFINEVSTLSVKNIKSNSLTAKTCADCAREGRANMVAGTLLGGLTGSAGGFFGAWAGAVAGFWAAGEVTVTCLKEAGC